MCNYYVITISVTSSAYPIQRCSWVSSIPDVMGQEPGSFLMYYLKSALNQIIFAIFPCGFLDVRSLEQISM